MKAKANIALIAALIGDPARADILTALITGQALTATELAAVAGVTKQTISAHLAKLLGAKLLSVTHQGRHKYFRLADEDVAQLLESLMGVAQRAGVSRVRVGPREPALRKARVCYDHLAGELGVLVFDSLKQRRLLRLRDDTPALTPRGRLFFQTFGIEVEPLAHQRRPLCRLCLDWSMRRYHLAGTLGKSVLERCLDLGWARRTQGTRVVTFPSLGEKALREQFHSPGT